MWSYIKAYRPLNLLLIGLSQVLVAYYLFFDSSWPALWEGGIQWIVLGTLGTAVYGYLLNDFYDVDRDAINKPGKYNFRLMDRRLRWIHYLAIFSVVLYSGNALGTAFAVCFAICLLALWVYNHSLKDIPLVGNLLIGMLSFLSVYIVGWAFPAIDAGLLLHFATLSGMINFCRELTKDAEDIKGDKMTGAHTFPVLFGLRTTNVVIYFSILFVISFVLISVYYQSGYFKGILLYVYYGYYLFFVIAPLFHIANQIRLLNEVREYRMVSSLMKYVLYTGILSILFY